MSTTTIDALTLVLAADLDDTARVEVTNKNAVSRRATVAQWRTQLNTGTQTVLGDLLFTDATYDIGKSGATRPRDGFFSRNLAVGGTTTLGGAVSLTMVSPTLALVAAGAAQLSYVSVSDNAGRVAGIKSSDNTASPMIGSFSGQDVDLVRAGVAALTLLASTDIQWRKALVALGGGAAPTLGTIGGSGPATAAQNSWMRVIDSTGAAFWVPAWK